MAEPLRGMGRRLQIFQARHACRAHQQVGEFVSQGKHPGSPAIGVINENERGVGIHQGEALKFVRGKRTVRIIAYDAIENYERARRVRPAPQQP